DPMFLTKKCVYLKNIAQTKPEHKVIAEAFKRAIQESQSEMKVVTAKEQDRVSPRFHSRRGGRCIVDQRFRFSRDDRAREARYS
ncbi:hypothetical protein H0H87_001647, partial [Tephrocybe sp. NHM501043]